MRIFLAGVMQGPHPGQGICDQGYRGRLKSLLEETFQQAEVYDPFADHQDSIGYDEATGREVFYRHNRMCREVDVLVAYLPEASMGTAIEMWEAHEHGRAVVFAITPLAHHWAVVYCSHAVYDSLDAFEAAARSGEVGRAVERLRASRSKIAD